MNFNLFKQVSVLFLPFAITFSRSIGDISIILVALFFLIKSYKENNWVWFHEHWIKFAFIYACYCIFINSALSLNSFESLKYSIFFLRWPLFAAACCFWIFSDLKSLKVFLFLMVFIVSFLFFDTWFQYFYGVDIFGNQKFDDIRLTGPYRMPYVGMWITKLILLPSLLLILNDNNKYLWKNSFPVLIIFTIFFLYFLTIFITGERMALMMSIVGITVLFSGFYLSKFLTLSQFFIFLIFIFLAIFFLYHKDSNLYDRSVNSTIFYATNIDKSSYKSVWMSAYDVWQQYPFFGAGLHKYREACGLLGNYGTVDNPIESGVCFHPHNISLQLLAETGIVGFLLFYTMVISLSIRLLKLFYVNHKWLNFFIMLNILIACFLPIQSNTNFFSNKYSSLVWLLIGLSLSVIRLVEKRFVKNKSNN